MTEEWCHLLCADTAGSALFPRALPYCMPLDFQYDARFVCNNDRILSAVHSFGSFGRSLSTPVTSDDWTSHHHTRRHYRSRVLLCSSMVAFDGMVVSSNSQFASLDLSPRPSRGGLCTSLRIRGYERIACFIGTVIDRLSLRNTVDVQYVGSDWIRQ